MTDQSCHTISNPAESSCPYRDLYIYYVDGNITRNVVLPSDGFLGNWEEDRFSFLFFLKPSAAAIDTFLVIRGLAEDFIDCASDLVIANLHYDVIKRLLGSKGFFQKKWFILSGLLRSEARAVTEMLSSRRAEIVESWIHEGIWHTYLGKNGSKLLRFHFNKAKG